MTEKRGNTSPPIGLPRTRAIGKKRDYNCQAGTDLCTLRAAMHESWQRPDGTALSPTAPNRWATMRVVHITLGVPRHTNFSKRWPPDHLWRLRPPRQGHVLQEGMPISSGIMRCNGFVPKSNQVRKE